MFYRCSLCSVQRYKIFLASIARFSSYQSKWVDPGGYDTGVIIYNTSSRSKVPLKTKERNLLTWYVCGPTVYDSAHIGHALTYVKCDIIRRILQNILKINVVQVMGITDIDDKIIKRASELDVNVRSIAQKYEEEFIRDMKKLNVLLPLVYSRVSDHISHILAFIQKIIDNGSAYSLDDGSVYFDTKAYGKYLKFVSGSSEEHLPPSRDKRKKSPRDFALWKAAKEDEPSWISPWGAGRPGWHIECSAMACHIFGESLDLHSGGIDLLFPHHENEEAQCCAHLAKEQWCNYWNHTGHLHLQKDSKMSKSLKNTITIEEFLSEHSANVFRYFCLLTPHRFSVEYSESTLQKALYYEKRIRSFMQNTQAYIHSQLICGAIDDNLLLKKLSDVENGVREALKDDFDTVTAMHLVNELVSECNKELRKSSKAEGVSSSLSTIAAVNNYIMKLFSDFGLKFPQHMAGIVDSESGPPVTRVLESLIKFRSDVRRFALLQDSKSLEMEMSRAEQKFLRQDRLALLQVCDVFRDELSACGVQIKDGKGHSTWTYDSIKTDKK